MEYFIIGYIVLLALDFLVMRGDISIRKSLSMTLFYIIASMVFGGYIWQIQGMNSASEFLTVFWLEKILSVDNLLVIMMIFSYFGINKDKQHTALLFGIFGAIFFRTVFILSGAWILEKIHWVLYVFAAFLIYTGFKIICGGDDSFDPSKRPMIRFLKNNFGKTGVLIGAIIAIEISDIMFAVDSIPASFGVSQNWFIVLTANLFAILGLRSLYHAVSAGLNMLTGMEKFIGFALILLGFEVCLNHWIEVPAWVTMAMTFTVIIGGFLFSNFSREAKEA